MNFLENNYFDVVLGEIKPFLDENGFKEADGYFATDAKRNGGFYKVGNITVE